MSSSSIHIDQAPLAADHRTPATTKWGAACGECAKTKSRCYRSGETPGEVCERCQRLGKVCIGQVKRPRKKRESKISKTTQIEERLDDLVRTLHRTNNLSGLAGNLSLDQPWVSSRADLATAASASPGDSSIPPDRTSVYIPPTYNAFGPQPCICRPAPGEVPGAVDADETLLSIYKEELMPLYPFIVIPKNVSAAQLQATRPFLMSCIRMVASFRSLRSMQGQMFRLKAYVAEHVLMRSERSLDLLAGLVVMLGWHHYHCVVHSQVHNLVSLAMSLVADIGLKRPPSWQERTKLMVVNLGDVRERTNEQKRLLLAVWYLSSSVSADLQQLEPMAFTPYMRQCLNELETSMEYETDAYLVQLIRLQHLAGKISQTLDECSEHLEGTGKAPFSAYVPAYESELDSLCSRVPERLQGNELIRAQINMLRLKLHEPPRLSAPLISNISKSLTQAISNTSSHSYLDRFYQSAAAIETWYTEWFEVPISTYHSLPMPIALQILYAITILGRYAKLPMPDTVRPIREPLPQDPSGSYNNPPVLSETPESSTAGDTHTPQSIVEEDELSNAMSKLKTQLSTQSGLSLDVTGLLGRLGYNLSQASALLAAQSQDPPGNELDIWSLSAAKVRIAQLKLQQWTESMASAEHQQSESQRNSARKTQENVYLQPKTHEDMVDPNILSANGNCYNGAGTAETWLSNATLDDFTAPPNTMDSFLWMDWEQNWGSAMMGHEIAHMQ